MSGLDLLFDVSVTSAGSHVFAVGANSTILGFRAPGSEP